jgi:hypothetical protein
MADIDFKMLDEIDEENRMTELSEYINDIAPLDIGGTLAYHDLNIEKPSTGNPSAKNTSFPSPHDILAVPGLDVLSVFQR